jgi:hypothetical protein
LGVCNVKKKTNTKKNHWQWKWVFGSVWGGGGGGKWNFKNPNPKLTENTRVHSFYFGLYKTKLHKDVKRMAHNRWHSAQVDAMKIEQEKKSET